MFLCLFFDLYSLQVYHWPAGAAWGDTPPHPRPHFGSSNCHHAHHLPLPSKTDSDPASAPQRSLHVQEHVVCSRATTPSALSKANPITDFSSRRPRPNTTEKNGLKWTDPLIGEWSLCRGPTETFQQPKIKLLGQLGARWMNLESQPAEIKSGWLLNLISMP